MIEDYSVTNTRLDLLDAFLGSACHGAASALAWASENLPPTSLIGIKLEDLSSDPSAVVTRILQFLEVESQVDNLKNIIFGNTEIPPGADAMAHKKDIGSRLGIASQILTEKHQNLFG